MGAPRRVVLAFESSLESCGIAGEASHEREMGVGEQDEVAVSAVPGEARAGDGTETGA